MARKRVAYRKRQQNRFSMILVAIVVVMITIVVSVKSVELKQKIAVVTSRQEQLEAQIEAEKKRAEEIANYRKYTQTKAFMEEVAKEKLGLVYEGEIVFKEVK